MCEIEWCVFITDEFQKVHQIVTVDLIAISLIRPVDFQQGIWNFSEYFSGFYFQDLNSR